MKIEVRPLKVNRPTAFRRLGLCSVHPPDTAQPSAILKLSAQTAVRLGRRYYSHFSVGRPEVTSAS